MRFQNGRFQKTSAIVAGAIALALAGCTKNSVLSHKLVATNGDPAVHYRSCR